MPLPWEELQQSVTAWGDLLISTGGALNPSKCYGYMVDYVCIDREWQYAQRGTGNWRFLSPMAVQHQFNRLLQLSHKKCLGCGPSLLVTTTSMFKTTLLHDIRNGLIDQKTAISLLNLIGCPTDPLYGLEFSMV